MKKKFIRSTMTIPNILKNMLRDNQLSQHKELQRPYILFVGTRNDYKNFQPLVRQIAGFLKKTKFDLK